MKQVILKIYGLVQGVGFRWSVCQRARGLGLTGFVRNEDDGSVKVVVQGAKEKVQELIGWCRQGIPFAKVDKVEVAWEDAGGQFSDFEITS
jgi:acylphosphatase